MSENLRYWLWLQRALGEGAFIKEIIQDFGSVENLYNANSIMLRMSSALTAKQITHLEMTDIHEVDEIIYSCQQNNWQIIDYDDACYPERLKEISNPPAVLYVDGNLPDIDNMVTIGIVGTRKASEYAVKVTHIMSMGITEAGALVVSGGALGVDTAAHKGALMAKGKTIAVLGCGLGTEYLIENESLRNVIKENGALITEYPPFTKASRYTFPLRNRIISGLSLGVLVVEAGVKSGSLITANYALEQGRDVFAIPGSVLSLDFAGTNKLIDDGAMVVTKPEHIIANYAVRFDTLDMSKVRSVNELMYEQSDKSANISKNKNTFSFDNLDKGREKRLKNEENARALKGDTRLVYEALDDSFIHIDEIINKTELTSSKVLAALTQLEIRGLAVSASGRRYKIS
ncbi:MAG: DNA-processing protein DprA [Acetobacter sp.]|nr:DNA-processing protein DprA [Bacteroides sp.]MCM1340730.1 DNA-processing protein DprA [Acetobacter sp.]MCM1433067.1 DNA-processing protein DprA [Clostridiales bacterium]